jgi:integrase
MPRKALPLNDTRIRGLKAKANRYSVSDGEGLTLEIMPSGSKIWRYRYSLHGRQQPLITIGDYPAIGLQEARTRARRYAALVASGLSPVAEARKDRGILNGMDTVREFAEFWYQSEMANKSGPYRVTTRRQLDKDVLPLIGNKPLSAVNAADILAICDKVKGRGSPQAALSTRNMLKRMFEFAIARQKTTSNPAAQVVPRFIATPVSRNRVLSAEEIGKVMRTIYASDIGRPDKLALHLLIITMVRKSDLIEAEWNELDLDAGIWRIPADRATKSKNKEHWVYLSRQACEMFAELRTLSHSQRFVFPARRGTEDKPIAKSTLNAAVRGMNMDVQHFVLHDFRRTASTHLNEMGLHPDAIEKALAHTIPGVRGVYNRAQYGEERRKLLQLWADFVDARIQEGKKINTGRFGQAA